MASTTAMPNLAPNIVAQSGAPTLGPATTHGSNQRYPSWRPSPITHVLLFMLDLALLPPYFLFAGWFLALGLVAVFFLLLTLKIDLLHFALPWSVVLLPFLILFMLPIGLRIVFTRSFSQFMSGPNVLMRPATLIMMIWGGLFLLGLQLDGYFGNLTVVSVVLLTGFLLLGFRLSFHILVWNLKCFLLLYVVSSAVFLAMRTVVAWPWSLALAPVFYLLDLAILHCWVRMLRSSLSEVANEVVATISGPPQPPPRPAQPAQDPLPSVGDALAPAVPLPPLTAAQKRLLRMRRRRLLMKYGAVLLVIFFIVAFQVILGLWLDRAIRWAFWTATVPALLAIALVWVLSVVEMYGMWKETYAKAVSLHQRKRDELMHVLNSGFARKIREGLAAAYARLMLDMEALLDRPEYSDIVFVVQGRTLHAHSIVLLLRLPVFDLLAALHSGKIPNTMEIQAVPNLTAVYQPPFRTVYHVEAGTYDALRAVLLYLYTSNNIYREGFVAALLGYGLPPTSYATNAASLGECMAAGVDNRQSADVEFVVNGERVYAHRAILAARCEYFRSMFASGMLESKQRETSISSCSHRVLRALMSPIYSTIVPWNDIVEAGASPTPAPPQTGDIEMGQVDGPASQLTALDQFIEYTQACTEYQVFDALPSCQKKLQSFVNVESVLPLLQFADAHHLELFRKYCLYYILVNYSAVVEGCYEEWAALPDELRQELEKLHSEGLALEIKGRFNPQVTYGALSASIHLEWRSKSKSRRRKARSPGDQTTTTTTTETETSPSTSSTYSTSSTTCDSSV